jgi:hypothetical protein
MAGKFSYKFNNQYIMLYMNMGIFNAIPVICINPIDYKNKLLTEYQKNLYSLINILVFYI